MSAEDTAIRLAGKLNHLTRSGKLKWMDGGNFGPWGEWPGQVFKALIDDGIIAQIAEVPIPRSLIASYYFGIAEGKPEIFKVIETGPADEFFTVFAEGYPAEPTNEKMDLLKALKDLFSQAKDSARGTWEKVEKFEQVLERLA